MKDPFDSPAALVLSTLPSLRGDNPPSFGDLSKALRWRGPRIFEYGENHDGTVGYFLVAVSAGVAASGIIGYILASMLIRRYEKADRPIKI